MTEIEIIAMPKEPTAILYADYVRDPDEVAARFGCTCLEELLIRFKVVKVKEFQYFMFIGKGDVWGKVLEMRGLKR